MKKLLMTMCAAGLFSIGAMAQVESDSTSNNANMQPGDTVQTDNKNGNNENDGINDKLQNPDPQSMDKDAPGEDDGVSNKLQDEKDAVKEGADKTGQAVEDAGKDVKEAGEKVGEEAKDAGQKVGEEAKEAGQAIDQKADETGNAIKEGAEDTKDAVDQTGKEIGQGVEKTGNEIQSGVKEDANGVQQNGNNNMNGDNMDESAAGSSEAMSYGPDVEVIPDKEGPRHEVVYKINDELYYVDRDKKEMVKANDSDLKDAKDQAVIHNSGEMHAEK